MSSTNTDAVHLAIGKLRCTVLPALGAGIADFSMLGPTGAWYGLMRRAAHGESNASLLASFFMAPWVNRVGGARFVFQGVEHALRATTPGGTASDKVVARHGDVRKRPWRFVSSDATHVECQIDSRNFTDFNWPWACVIRARYELAADGLRIDLAVTNVDTRPMPAGCGHHPYFARRLWRDDDELRVMIPASGRYPLENGCAVGAPADDELCRRLRGGLAPVPREPLDGVFARDHALPNTSVLEWPASRVRLSIEASANLGHWVFFAPHERADAISPLGFVAVEPQSQVNGALAPLGESATGTGTVVLKPGETLSTTCVFRVSEMR